MDNLKLILGMAWLFLLLMLYQTWQQDYGPKPAAPISATASGINTQGGINTIPVNASATPHTAELPIAVAGDNSGSSLPGVDNRLLQSKERVKVSTDVLNVEIDTLGGDVRIVGLPGYPVSIDKPDEPFRLLDDESNRLYVLQSGLLGGELAPNHQAQYQVSAQEYKLADGQQKLAVTLSWKHSSGIEVQKIYHFERGSYIVNVEHKVRNLSGESWQGSLYAQLQRAKVADPNQSRFIYTYLGGAVATPETLYHKVTFDDIDEDSVPGQQLYVAPNGSLNSATQAAWSNGWLAMLQHYFVAAVIPDKTQEFNYYAKHLSAGDRYLLGLTGKAVQVAANSEYSFEMQFYAGPKLQHILGELSPGLELTVDYGYLWFLAQPLFWLLEMLHAMLGNWGWSIIFLTIMIKLAFFKLSAASYKSMANMRRLQPRLAALKERYADDRQGMNQAMMDLYKKEKINPLGGCLPILVQIPVFISLYWVLLESVELRQADFMFWINDLSIPDPFFILPVVMGVTMLVQHYLNPAPVDPMQQKIMMILPLVFTVFFAFFPAGLVLYWVVNNMLSIAQQWYITRKIAPDTLPASAGGSGH